MTARNLLLALALATSASQAGAQATEAHVIKTNGCGCCLAWMEHLEENGFSVTGENMFGGALVRYKLDQGVPQRMISCHTAEIDGYVVEGHVPAADIKRLLEERPDAIGLAVPGMPLGSPGMDFGDRQEAYDVFLIRNDGSTEVFASYPAPE
ncbi:DUF411 domain-containing protein [Roseitranquillus sediminis]|uniref:DUF411 domain-containing protein n=1 Tax=Roseitranquillus sediminis TaxID=2809051 RepID=UPI001D0C6423|nr:DUF411 domain-containing protein [Roseitranquillus sediminis]MBM9595112.1 DUF411 domain-containing protein [Roseitranquillus sediminis]